MLTDNLLTLTADIVAAHVGHNIVEPGDVPALITAVGETLERLAKDEPEPVELVPAVSIRASVKADHVTCLECGTKAKMLKRHLMTAHQLTPEQYRARWGLSADYPMVAPEYADKRRELAKAIGLGRMPGQRRGRRPAKASKAA